MWNTCEFFKFEIGWNFVARAKHVSLRALRRETIHDVMVVVPRLPKWVTHGRGILKGFCTLKLPGEASHLIFKWRRFQSIFSGRFLAFFKIKGKSLENPCFFFLFQHCDHFASFLGRFGLVLTTVSSVGSGKKATLGFFYCFEVAFCFEWYFLGNLVILKGLGKFSG